MTQLDNTTIRRRPDGSIDTPFYARNAALERRAAMNALAIFLFRRTIRTFARTSRHPASVGEVPSELVLRYTVSPHD